MTYSTRMNTMWGLVATAVVQSTTDNNTSAAVFFIAAKCMILYVYGWKRLTHVSA